MNTMPFTMRPIEPRDDAAMARIIRTVMPEFGADGPGFAIHDAEVDTMSEEMVAQTRRAIDLATTIADSIRLFKRAESD